MHFRYRFCDSNARFRLDMAADREQDENNPSRAYVQRVMDALEVDPTTLARQAKVSPSTLTGLMRERPRVKSLRYATLRLLEQISNVPLPPELTAARTAMNGRVVAVDPNRDVPLHATAPATRIGAYFLNQTAAYDYAPRPPGIQQARRIFAIRMPDDSMDGWRRVNELVYVDPMRAVADGDHALIELTDAQAPDNPSMFMVRRVSRRRANTVTLATWGLEPSEQNLDRRAVLSYRRILEWSELMGMGA